MSESMKYTSGQTITVMRGKTRGQTAEVLGVDTENSQYAVKYANGTFGVINAVNVKEPTEATLTEGKLAAEIQTALNDNPDAVDLLQALVSRLGSDLPGLGARISWPVSDSAS